MRLAPFALAAALAACSSTPTDPAADPQAGQGATPPGRTVTAPNSAAAPAPQLMSRGLPAGRSIYYEYDKSEVRAESRALIEANARYLREHPEVKVRIE